MGKKKRAESSCTTGAEAPASLAEEDGLVLFLDVDGVILPFPEVSDDEPKIGRFPRRNLVAFAALLEAVPRATVVLSSTWRCDPEAIDELIKAFDAFGGPLAPLASSGFTHTTALDHHTERQHEIGAWLFAQNAPGFADGDSEDVPAKRLDVRAWVALDDEELLEGARNRRLRPRFEGHARQVNSASGLTDDDALAALEMLRQQLRPKPG